MPLVEVSFAHPNSGQRYHRELWEVDEAIADELREFLDGEDVWEERVDDHAFNEDSATSDVIKSFLQRGLLIHKCQPTIGSTSTGLDQSNVSARILSSERGRMDFEVDGDPKGLWEFECCGCNNVEFRRAGDLTAQVYEGECRACGTRYQVTEFRRGKRSPSKRKAP